METLQATFTDILNKFSRAFEDLTRVDHVRSQSHLKSLGCLVKAGTKSSAEGISNRGLCGRTMYTGQRVWLLLGIQYQDNILTGDRKLRAGPTHSMANKV